MLVWSVGMRALLMHATETEALAAGKSRVCFPGTWKWHTFSCNQLTALCLRADKCGGPPGWHNWQGNVAGRLGQLPGGEGLQLQVLVSQNSDTPAPAA